MQYEIGGPKVVPLMMIELPNRHGSKSQVFNLDERFDETIPKTHPPKKHKQII